MFSSSFEYDALKFTPTASWPAASLLYHLHHVIKDVMDDVICTVVSQMRAQQWTRHMHAGRLH